jgi:TonB-dependent starch-binding outer membrane protein SusC
MCKQSDQFRKALCFALLLFISSNLLAQNRVTGKITTQSDNQSIAGATILEKGTTNGTVSANDGSFAITVGSNATLVISFIGYTSQEVRVNGRNNISVALQSAVGGMNEVVVIGYGTQRRTNVTSAISSIDSKTLNELPVPNLSQALQGRMAGVSVVNNGSPGSQPIVRIRGISSITGSGDPLYVVDGIPTGDISSFDMRDVETVDVLKDASAAAIYGSRATNGVIIITTKKGKRDGRLHVGLNSYYGVQTITKRLDLLDREGFMKYAVAYRGSQVPRLLDPWLTTPIYTGATQTYGQTNTNWQDEYFRDGPMTETNIDLNGGNEISRFSFSAGYFDQKGTAPNVSFKRYNLKLSSDHKLSKVFTFGETLFASNSSRNGDANSGGTRSNLVNVIRMMPHMPVHDPTSNGGYRGVNATLDGGDPTNPIEDAELKNPQTNTTLKILGNAFLDINFTNWLKFKSSFGVDYSNGLFYRFQPIFNDNGTINGSSATQATITNNRGLSTVLLYTEQLTFDKKFGEHHLTATGVFESQHQKTKNENGSGNQPSNNLRILQNALNQSVSTSTGENFLVSLVGRINYDFAGKYLISGAIRRDGLSVWAPGHKWGNFPSASIGWKIDQESFMKNQSLFSQLKLRAGYGVTGINGTLLGNTPWLVNVDANSATYPFNNLNPGGLGSSVNQLGNPELEWETTKQTNVGVDLGILHNKLTLTADYFHRQTDNLILSVTVPPSFGYLNNSVNKNIGALENNGLEFLLGYNGQAGDFRWNASANATFTKNKVLKLAPGLNNLPAGADAADFGGWDVTNTEPGKPIQYFYGFIVDGIFQTASEVSNSPFQTTATAPGDLKFRDISGPNGKPDGKIDSYDRADLGSYLPKVSYGLNISADYKNFDLGIFFQGVQGNKIYNDTRVITEGMIRFFNAGKQVLNAWTPTNTNTNIPRAVANDPNGNARTSTRFLENGSYLRLKNITLGYNFSSRQLTSLTKGTVSSFRIYVSGQNLLTFTDYTGYDPEVGNRTGSSLTNGIDWAIYPQPKAVQVGIQVNFQ